MRVRRKVLEYHKLGINIREDKEDESSSNDHASYHNPSTIRVPVRSVTFVAPQDPAIRAIAVRGKEENAVSDDLWIITGIKFSSVAAGRPCSYWNSKRERSQTAWDSLVLSW